MDRPLRVEYPGAFYHARYVAIYLSRNFTGRSGKDLGEYLDNVSGAAITMRHKAMADQIKKNKKLNSRINRLEKQKIKN
ncbi:MAG: hypothetical protein JEZ11_20670 [Desulfobacterales bacterium]|nr:hypothetical protein [Desulfobacterales bacterium]